MQPDSTPTTTEDTTKEIPYGYCHCGCGQRTKIAPQTSQRSGAIKGEPNRFIYGHQVRPKTGATQRFWDRVDTGDGCWEWRGAKNRLGYGMLSGPEFKGGVVRAHRFAYALLIGPIPKGMVICHRCDNPSCCNPDHLFAGSQSDNIHDMWRKGRNRTPYGERASAAVLTEAQVREIRDVYARGAMNGVEIAACYGIGRSTVYSIINQETWKHV